MRSEKIIINDIYFVLFLLLFLQKDILCFLGQSENLVPRVVIASEKKNNKDYKKEKKKGKAKKNKKALLFPKDPRWQNEAAADTWQSW